MEKENAILNDEDFLNKESTESFDFDELEEKLQSQLEEEFSDMEFLAEEKEKIGNSENLGKVITDVVWKQFLNQVAVTAGEDFIKENRGLHLDLRNEAHIQTTENFANGKIATHNTEIDYQKRRDDWLNNFQRNEDGSIKMEPDTRSGKEKAVLRTKNTKKDPNGENYNTNYNAREFIDKGRPQGSKTVHKDHTVSAAEIIRDPEAAAHMTREEQAAFANSDVNLGDLDSRANESKGDSTMSEWLDSERNGEKPADRFPIDEEELRKRDAEARAEYEKQKKEAEQRSIEAGKRSQKAEALRIGKETARAIIMNLLADLVRKIVQKLIAWFKSGEKNLKALLASIKDAIVGFVLDLKNSVINVTDTAFTVIATSIVGPIIGTIKKAWMLIKQGLSSLKKAIDYIRRPENKGKPVGILMMEVGKILIGGLTAAGAIVLGEVIEKNLEFIPLFKIQIPLLGSLANIIGIFMGAVVAGIIGAIAINLIEKKIEKSMKRENVNAQMDKSNEILRTQRQLQTVCEWKLEHTKTKAAENIYNNHVVAADMMSASIENIRANCATGKKNIKNGLDNIDKLLKELEG